MLFDTKYHNDASIFREEFELEDERKSALTKFQNKIKELTREELTPKAVEL